MHYTEGDHIKVTDSALVAYLAVQGHKHSSIETIVHQALFVFPCSIEVEQDIADFYRNSGRFLEYHKHYRQVLRDIAIAFREHRDAK